MKYFNAILLLSLFQIDAFTPNINIKNSHHASRTVHRMAVTAEESAKALTEYMAKSHEEKLKALKELENKKNAEIESLKEQLKSAESKSSIVVSTPAPAPTVEGSIEELSQKLLAYQNFMAEYVVKAQEEKFKAVKAAEAAVTKKYEEKLSAFLLTGSAPEAAAPALTTAASSLYEGRNANLAAAAKAGKSRWGAQEIQKVTGAPAPKGSVIKAIEPDTSPVSMEVIAAADHGLRADGGVGGLSLAERVTAGAAVQANGVALPSTSPNLVYYDMRNANIAKAAKAGKQSRWGSKEEEKTIVIASNALPAANGVSTVVASPEVIAADHGLRADGGVGGPSLAERVNLGARLL